MMPSMWGDAQALGEFPNDFGLWSPEPPPNQYFSRNYPSGSATTNTDATSRSNSKRNTLLSPPGQFKFETRSPMNNFLAGILSPEPSSVSHGSNVSPNFYLSPSIAPGGVIIPKENVQPLHPSISSSAIIPPVRTTIPLKQTKREILAAAKLKEMNSVNSFQPSSFEYTGLANNATMNSLTETPRKVSGLTFVRPISQRTPGETPKRTPKRICIHTPGKTPARIESINRLCSTDGKESKESLSFLYDDLSGSPFNNLQGLFSPYDRSTATGATPLAPIPLSNVSHHNLSTTGLQLFRAFM